MKFIADVMLGSLARRLRLLGYDVLYSRTFGDNDIIKIALEEQRTILTRDSGLSHRPLAENHVFIRSDHLEEQLRQVLEVMKQGDAGTPFSRCSRCNTKLTSLSKNDAKDRVPLFIYETHGTFMQCTTCGRIYWTGSHVRNMQTRKQ